VLLCNLHYIKVILSPYAIHNLQIIEVKVITGTQCAAARALLRWKQSDLSNAIAQGGGKFSVTALATFERGGAIRDSNAQAIQAALEGAGVILIPANGGGAGVRLRDPDTSGAVVEND